MSVKTRTFLSHLIATVLVLGYIGTASYIGFTYGAESAGVFFLFSLLAVVGVVTVLNAISILAEGIEDLLRRFF